MINLAILDFLGSIFGYILWFIFDAVSNYTVAITIFTILINLLMFPFAIKRQKTMASHMRMNEKQQELKKRYEKDVKKYNEEVAKLYEKEGFSPMSGCLTMFLPMILWFCIIGPINRPLKNTLHIPDTKITAAVEMLPTLPEVEGQITQGYEELQIVNHFSKIKEHLTMFNEEELADIEEYSSGFNLMGINLLRKPNDGSFSDMLWLIPVLYFVISILMAYFMQKVSEGTNQVQGCMKFMPYGVSVITAWFAYTVPGAMGIYWILNSFLGIIQNLILNKFYNVYEVNAKEEAARYARLKIQESK